MEEGGYIMQVAFEIARQNDKTSTLNQFFFDGLGSVVIIRNEVEGTRKEVLERYSRIFKMLGDDESEEI